MLLFFHLPLKEMASSLMLGEPRGATLSVPCLNRHSLRESKTNYYIPEGQLTRTYSTASEGPIGNNFAILIKMPLKGFNHLQNRSNYRDFCRPSQFLGDYYVSELEMTIARAPVFFNTNIPIIFFVGERSFVNRYMGHVKNCIHLLR